MAAIPTTSFTSSIPFAKPYSTSCLPYIQKRHREMNSSMHVRNLKAMMVLHCNNSRNFLSTISSAVATDSSSETAISTEPNQNDEKEKIVLPTNESSQRLLRIRHTVMQCGSLSINRVEFLCLSWFSIFSDGISRKLQFPHFGFLVC